MRSGRFPRFGVATDVVYGFVDEPGGSHLQTIPSSGLQIEENLIQPAPEKTGGIIMKAITESSSLIGRSAFGSA